MTMMSTSIARFHSNLCLRILAALLLFQAKAGDAFTTNCGIVKNSFSSNSLQQNACRDYREGSMVLSARKRDTNDPNQDDKYDFIARSEANKMLQEERRKNEREIHQLKNILKRQHQELLEYDNEALNIQLANEDDSDVIDPEIFEEVERERASEHHESPFSHPFSDSVDEEHFREHHERSHTNAEYRTIEIALQQIHEDNQDLKNEVNSQQDRYQAEIEETLRMIADTRDRYDCIRHELELENLYYEKAKAQIEEVLDRERARARELEEQMVLARREQEILEQAAIVAQQRQQELQEREELELQRQQEQMQVEREELERQQQRIQQEQEDHERQLQQELMQLEEEEQRKRQQLQQEEQERFRQEELLRNHQELVDLEQHQKDFDDVYFNVYNDNGPSMNENVNKNPAQHQTQNPGNSVYSTPSSQYPQYDAAQQQQQKQQYEQYQQQQYDLYQQQQWEWQHTINVRVATQKKKDKDRASKREIRKNKGSHGIFMNFNDLLM